MFRVRRCLLPLYCSLAAIVASPAVGYELEGSLSSQLHWYEEADQQHIRPYESLRLNWKFMEKGGRSLSLHTYSRFTTDFGDQLPSDPQLFVRNAYLNFSCRPNRLQLNVGRQFVYVGAGNGLIDGLNLQLRKFQPVSIRLFAGSSVSRIDPEEVRTLSDHAVFGGELSANVHPRIKSALSWILQKDDGDIRRHRLSFDGRYMSGYWQLFGRVGYDPLNAEISELSSRIDWTNRVWYLSGEYLRRAPSVAANSIFSLINYQQYQIMRVEARHRLSPDLSVFIYHQSTIYDEDNSWDLSTGVQKGYYKIGYRHESGYLGEYNGLFGSARMSAFREWQLYTNFNLSRYRVQVEQENNSDAYAANLGLERKFSGGLSTAIEVQFIRNAISSDDWRLYFQLTKYFNLKD